MNPVFVQIQIREEVRHDEREALSDWNYTVSISCAVNVKCPCTRHEDIWEEWRYDSIHSETGYWIGVVKLGTRWKSVVSFAPRQL